MGAMASQITSLTIVYSTVYSGADQRKHQSSASLAFVRGIHRSPVNSPHKWPVTRKMFPFDDVFMSVLRNYSKCWYTFTFSISNLARQVNPKPAHLCQKDPYSLKWKYHFDEFFITGCSVSCQCDKFMCIRWRKFGKKNHISASVFVRQTY